MEDEVIANIQKDHAEKARKGSKRVTATDVTEILTEFDKASETHKPSAISEKDPLSTPPGSPLALKQQSTEDVVSIEESYRSQANVAFASVGAKAPCKSLPSFCGTIPSNLVQQSPSSPSGKRLIGLL